MREKAQAVTEGPRDVEGRFAGRICCILLVVIVLLLVSLVYVQRSAVKR